MRANNTLKNITLEKCEFEEKVIPAVCSVFDVHQFEIVELQGNKFSDDAATKLAKSLNFSKQLKELNLSANLISNAGAAALGKMLLDKPTEILDLSFNLIGDAGAAALSESLTYHKNLRTLFLNGNNEIHNDGKQSLSYLCQRNRYIQEILFGEFHLTSEIIASLRLLYSYGIAEK
jgi:Ran GTPase-activating protein (RanGAP) involved in mRNA processing and transport